MSIEEQIKNLNQDKNDRKNWNVPLSTSSIIIIDQQSREEGGILNANSRVE